MHYKSASLFAQSTCECVIKIPYITVIRKQWPRCYTYPLLLVTNLSTFNGPFIIWKYFVTFISNEYIMMHIVCNMLKILTFEMHTISGLLMLDE